MADLTTLQTQAHRLVQTAPAHGIPVIAMQHVAAMLIQVAQQLQHSAYATLRYSDQSWLLIPQPVQPGASEPCLWLPAFASSADAEAIQQKVEGMTSDLQITVVDTVQLLFHGLGLRQAQGILFYEEPGHPSSSQPIWRQDLQRGLHQTLKSIVQDPIA
jgi:hypothetical protein